MSKSSSVVYFAILAALLLLCALELPAEGAAPVCKAPAGYIEYVALVTAPVNATPACIAVAQEYRKPLEFAFEDGVYVGAGVQETYAKGCGVKVQLDDKGDRGLVLRFDANWYRGTGVFLEEGCMLGLRFVRN